MGMYTAVYFTSRIYAPHPVIDILRHIIALNEREELTDAAKEYISNSKHKFFQTPRWEYLTSNSFYIDVFPMSYLSKIDLFNHKDYWEFSLNGQLKNYDDEIKLFFDWIKEYIEIEPTYSKFVGYILYEEDPFPSLVYVKNNNGHNEISVINVEALERYKDADKPIREKIDALLKLTRRNDV